MRILSGPPRGALAVSFLFLTILAARVDALAAGLTLTWVDNSRGQDGFSIERSTTSTGPFAEVARTAPGVTAYADTAVPDERSYCYRVRAYNVQGVSPYSNVACSAMGSASSAFITDFYRIVLGRVPGPQELGPWSAFVAANCNQAGLRAVADAFFSSQEFGTSRPLTLTGLVTTLYQALLNRAPDPAGLAAWTDTLRQDRIDAAMMFIESDEFNSLVRDRRDRAVVTPAVTRMYTAILGRSPDPAGLQGWVNYIATTLDLEGAAVAFLTSPEFEARPLTFHDFVQILYLAFLGREPDPSGGSGWEGMLGAQFLGALDAQFVPSPEFQTRIPQVCGA